MASEISPKERVLGIMKWLTAHNDAESLGKTRRTDHSIQPHKSILYESDFMVIRWAQRQMGTKDIQNVQNSPFQEFFSEEEQINRVKGIFRVLLLLFAFKIGESLCVCSMKLSVKKQKMMKQERKEDLLEQCP